MRRFLAKQGLLRRAVRRGIWLLRPFSRQAFIVAVRAGERIGGPGFLSALTVPLIMPDILLRASHYPRFKRFRRVLPSDFWRMHPFRHYLRMIHVWDESLAVGSVYDRLGSAAWASRMTTIGTAPERLDAWGERPVILAFLHTGGFGLLGSWLRVRGLPAAAWLRSVPEVAGVCAVGIRARGDGVHGCAGVPHTFVGPGSLRAALRWLRPGRVLSFPLDGAMEHERLVACRAGGRLIYLQDGAVRLARRANAVLQPVSVHRTGPCRYLFRFGEPVPEAVLHAKETRGAMEHLARELWVGLAEDPSSIGWGTLASLDPKEQKVWTFP